MKRKIFAIVFAAISVGALVYFLSRKPNEEKTPIANQPESKLTSVSAPIIPTPTANPLTMGQSEQPTNVPSPPAGISQVEKWKWLNAMEEKDRFFQYKAPISFYGRVIDDSDNPVAGALIKLSWTDANEATGNSTRTITSDAAGLFSIENVHGKALLVTAITKPGYTKSLVQNKFTFNYGYFKDPSFYTPDPFNPIIFVLRKDRQGEALIVRGRQEAKLESAGQSKSFPIGAGDVFVNVERLPDEMPNARYWNALVTVADGSLQLTSEEFPFEAPENGYTNSFVITNGLSMQGNQGGIFYVKTPKGYGRVKIYYVPNMPWIYAESWFNPNPNSRDLELDPSKQIGQW